MVNVDIINIFEDVADGVILTEKFGIETKLVDVVFSKELVAVLTTCKTLPPKPVGRAVIADNVLLFGLIIAMLCVS
tara:strand:+ start:447 stop:674 length:228 start_codon:yes stop_codon:yes gene_type:complete